MLFRRAPERRRRWILFPVLVVALVGIGYLGYTYGVSNLIATASYRSQVRAIQRSWQQPEASQPPRADGQPTVGVLRIPAFGPGYQVPVRSGTTPDVLNRGVGHYPTTADPGQVGNCGIAGLRAGHGQPFARLHELAQGDEIVVETRQAVFTYVLDVAPRELTVTPKASWVLEPVPGHPRARPRRALLTVTTSQDIWPTPDRSVGFAHLASTQNKR